MKFVKLGEVCEILDTLRKPITKKFRKQGKYPYYGATGIVDYIDNYIFDESLVLIGEDGAKWEKGEQTAFVASGKYWVNNHAHVVRPFKDKINQIFLVYYLNSIDLKPWVTGLTVPKLNQEKLKSIPIPLFSLEKQRRIVAKLDKLHIKINELIKNKSSQIRNINSFFESSLVKNFNNDKYKNTKLKSLCSATQGVQIPKNNHIKSPRKGFLRYLYISDFSHNKNLKYVENKFPKKIVKSTDIIVVNTGASAGNIFRGIEGILSNNLFKVETNQSLLDADFLYYFVTSNLFKNFQKKIMRGAANPHMGHENFLNASLNLPPLNIQKDIVLKLIELDKNIKNLKQNYLKKINYLNDLKLKLISFQQKEITNV